MSSGLAPSFQCATGLDVAGSIRQTVPSRLHATQTESKPYAIAVGPSPTLIRVSIRRSRIDTGHDVVALAYDPDRIGADSNVNGDPGRDAKGSTTSFVSGSMRSRPLYFVVTQVASESAEIAVAKSEIGTRAEREERRGIASGEASIQPTERPNGGIAKRQWCADQPPAPDSSPGFRRQEPGSDGTSLVGPS